MAGRLDVGGKVELFENLGKEHDHINDCGNDNDSPQFVKNLGSSILICGGVINNDQYHGDQCRTCRKGGC